MHFLNHILFISADEEVPFIYLLSFLFSGGANTWYKEIGVHHLQVLEVAIIKKLVGRQLMLSSMTQL